MKSELSFLLELALKHKLPKVTKEAILARIEEVEVVNPQRMVFGPPSPMPSPQTQQPTIHPSLQQSPSTLAAMARHAAADPNAVPIIMPAVPAVPAPLPVTVIAQTPMTAAAMMSRNQAIGEGIRGKPEKGQTSPRKW